MSDSEGGKKRRLGLRAEVALGIGLGFGLAAAFAAAVMKAVRARNKRRAPLRSELWNSSLDTNGRIVGFRQLLEKVQLRGVEPGLKASVWPFLLQLYDVSSTANIRLQQHEELAAAYERLLDQCEGLDSKLNSPEAAGKAMLPPGMERRPEEGSSSASGANGMGGGGAGGRRTLGSSRQAVLQFEEAQRIIVLDAVRTEMMPLMKMERDARGGGAADEAGAGMALKREGRQSRMIGGKLDPGSLGASPVWNGLMAQEMLASSSNLSPAAKKFAARLISVLSAYSVHDPEVGYCQGMADLAAPFVAVMPDDSEAFWCFERLMSSVRGCFSSSGEGMRAQLASLGSALAVSDPVLSHKLRQVGAGDCLFAYRMALVRMRREINLPYCLLLWEMLWADELLRLLHTREEEPEGQQPHQGSNTCHGDVPDLFTCFMAEVVRGQRRPILDGAQTADDIARVFASYSINVWRCMQDAKRLRAAISASRNEGVS